MTILNLTLSITILLMTILADFLLKKAANMDGFSGWKFCLVSAFIYFISAIGWFFIYKKTKFITLGMFYSLGHLMLTLLIAILIFKEKINFMEAIGVLFGVVSVFILLRYSNN